VNNCARIAEHSSVVIMESLSGMPQFYTSESFVYVHGHDALRYLLTHADDDTSSSDDDVEDDEDDDYVDIAATVGRAEVFNDSGETIKVSHSLLKNDFIANNVKQYRLLRKLRMLVGPSTSRTSTMLSML
jgi:hypothetical protein